MNGAGISDDRYFRACYCQRQKEHIMKRTIWIVAGVVVVAAICGLLSCGGVDQKGAANAPAAARVNPDISKPGINIDWALLPPTQGC